MFVHFWFEAASFPTIFVFGWDERNDLFVWRWYVIQREWATWRCRFLHISKEILLQRLSKLSKRWNSFLFVRLAQLLCLLTRSSSSMMQALRRFFIIQITRSLAPLSYNLTSTTPQRLDLPFHYFLPIMLFVFTKHLLHQFINWIQRQFNSLIK